MANGKRTDSRPPPDPDALMTVGTWIWLDIPNHPAIVGFTYVDPEAGFSAQGWKVEGAGLDQSSRIIVRLPVLGMPWRHLSADEVGAFGLESAAPSWVAEFYGPQPPAGSPWGAWRNHPKLKGRFLPDHPDDLQVLVHDGGPRLSPNPAEAVWVSVVGADGEVFRGRVLNRPHNLRGVRQGSEIQFVVADGAEFPVMTTDKYLRERGAWDIHPCQQCGFSELFDAPSDLQQVVFPTLPADADVSRFTSFCPLCVGVQVVSLRANPLPRESAPAPQSGAAPQAQKQPWWKFW